MPVCVPIKDMRDTAAFSQLIEKSAEPVIVTKNGYDQFVVIKSRDFDKLKQAAAKAHLMERLAQAEAERSAGMTLDAYASIDEIAQQYGL